MHQFYYHNARDVLYHVSRNIHAYGEKVAPRDQKTRELRHVTITVEDPTACLCSGMGRGFNPRLAAAETLQLIGGFADPEWMTRVAPRYLEFTGGAMTGAYGPRLRDQLGLCEDALRKDRDTRQAVATIWTPERDLMQEHGDRPCTVYLSFMIRNERLILSTYMRSQDILLGWTYDSVMFQQLLCSMANVLDVAVGEHVHTVQSLHLYERDIEQMLHINQPDYMITQRLHGLDGNTWDDVQELARNISYNPNFPIETPTEHWLQEQSTMARV